MCIKSCTHDKMKGTMKENHYETNCTENLVKCLSKRNLPFKDALKAFTEFKKYEPKSIQRNAF